ncbi:MAG TPA: V-type ATP synthase subunit E [Coriobacteriia bacterium]|nr:V-type ATP synthase subunit E [Coriobacteriia bacterium]
MALDDIFRALEEQADRDIEAVLEEARAHAAAIREEAKREADTSRDTRIADAERVAKSRSAQDLNSVRLEARKRVAAVKERAVREVFDSAREQLGSVRAGSDYPSVFRSLADEALAGVEPGFEMLVDPSDSELARAFVAEKGLVGEVKPELSSAGGVVIVTQGGSVLKRNTLEDRLDKLRGLAQADVAEIVFA